MLFAEYLLIDKFPLFLVLPFENTSHWTSTASPVIPEAGLIRLPKRNGWALFKEIYPRSRRVASLGAARGHAFGNLATRIIAPGYRGCNKFDPEPTSAWPWNSLGDVLPSAFFIFAFREALFSLLLFLLLHLSLLLVLLLLLHPGIRRKPVIWPFNPAVPRSEREPSGSFVLG